MQDHSLIFIFTSRLNKLNITYMVTGSVASIVYGEPRLTHDIDLVIDMKLEDTERFAEAFPLDLFYCPPMDVIRIETGRANRGHFNLIHHETGFKADVYPRGRDLLHNWALKKRKRVDFEDTHIFVAPIEYVILRKLEYYKEGKSEKHLRDIEGMVKISNNEIDFDELEKRLKSMKLVDEWQLVSR